MASNNQKDREFSNNNTDGQLQDATSLTNENKIENENNITTEKLTDTNVTHESEKRYEITKEYTEEVLNDTSGMASDKIVKNENINHNASENRNETNNVTRDCNVKLDFVGDKQVHEFIETTSDVQLPNKPFSGIEGETVPEDNIIIPNDYDVKRHVRDIREQDEKMCRETEKEAHSNGANLSDSVGAIHLHDAHPVHADEHDGLLKFLGKACGVDKKKLQNEDFEPYERNSQYNVGARLAREGAETRSKYTKLETQTVSSNGEQRGRMYRKRNETKSGRNPIGQPTDANVNVCQSGLQETHQGSNGTHAQSHNEVQNTTKLEKPIDRVTGSVPLVTKSRPRVANKDNDEMYDFSHSQRGYMVLVVNDMFVRQSSRDGAECDLRKMKEIGRKFGFRSLRYQTKDRNLSKPELERLLCETQRADHSDCDCFLFMISTHGLEQQNAKKGGKTDHALVCADDQLIFTSTIVDMFNDKNCPSLKGKPKLFWIQACRGEDLDHGSHIAVAHTVSEDRTCGVTASGPTLISRESSDESDTRWGQDSWKPTETPSSSRNMPYAPEFSARRPPQPAPNMSQAPSEGEFINIHASRPIVTTPYAIVGTPSLKCHEDMLIMYAIPPGMFAWRNTNDGSWMIDYLHQVLMRYNFRKPKNFLTLLTQVNAMMSMRSTNTPRQPETDGKTAISVIEHKLCKDIIFEQKVPLSDWTR